MTGVAGGRRDAPRALGHDAGELVPHDAGIFEKRMLALEDVEIGAADADAPDMQQDLVGGAMRRRSLIHRELAGLCADESRHAGHRILSLRPGKAAASLLADGRLRR